MLQTGRPLTWTDIHADPALTDDALAATPQALTDAIDELLVLQRGRELGFSVGDDDVDRVVERLRIDNQVTDNESFTALLVSQGIPPDRFRDVVRAQIGVEQVRQEITRRVRATDGEAETYFTEHRDEFEHGPTVTFAEILVTLPPVENEAFDRAVIRLVKAQDRLGRGEPFDQVALDLSDAPSRDSGGVVGPVPLNSLPAPVAAALMRLAPGRIAPPVRTDEGYRLVRLDGLSPARPTTFAGFHDEAMARLLAARRGTAFAAELARLRRDAVMVWKDKTLQALYTAPRSNQPPYRIQR